MMHINKIPRTPAGIDSAVEYPISTPVGADYAHEHNTPAIRRGRFIAPTAAVSALAGVAAIPLIL